jgi:hypothetical protein
MIIRASQKQLELLQGNLARAGNSAGLPSEPHKRRPKACLPENVLERQITDLLAAHGFVNLRQHSGLFIPLRIAKQIETGQLPPEAATRNIVRTNEVGAADWLSLRPMIEPGRRPLDAPWLWQGFFWECKAPSRRPTEAQLVWLDRRRQVGLEATWFNQFQLRDRPSPAVEPRESNVFEVWFLNYFTRGQHGLEG